MLWIQAIFVSKLYPCKFSSERQCFMFVWYHVAFEFSLVFSDDLHHINFFICVVFHCLHNCLLERHKMTPKSNVHYRFSCLERHSFRPFIQILYNWLIPIVIQLFGHVLPWRSTKIRDIREVKKRTKKTRKWCHICHDLLIFFKTLFTVLLWMNGILLYYSSKNVHLSRKSNC